MQICTQRAHVILSDQVNTGMEWDFMSEWKWWNNETKLEFLLVPAGCPLARYHLSHIHFNGKCSNCALFFLFRNFHPFLNLHNLRENVLCKLRHKVLIFICQICLFHPVTGQQVKHPILHDKVKKMECISFWSAFFWQKSIYWITFFFPYEKRWIQCLYSHCFDESYVSFHFSYNLQYFISIITLWQCEKGQTDNA